MLTPVHRLWNPYDPPVWPARDGGETQGCPMTGDNIFLSVHEMASDII